MGWPGVRRALAPLFKARGEPGAEKRLKFNLEAGGDRRLPGNAVEARLAAVFRDGWPNRPHAQAIRDAVPERLWSADYKTVGEQRAVMAPGAELHFATGRPGYLRRVFARPVPHRAFAWLAREPADRRRRPPGWPETRYETKARAAGRACVHARFARRGGSGA